MAIKNDDTNMKLILEKNKMSLPEFRKAQCIKISNIPKKLTREDLMQSNETKQLNVSITKLPFHCDAIRYLNEFCVINKITLKLKNDLPDHSDVKLCINGYDYVYYSEGKFEGTEIVLTNGICDFEHPLPLIFDDKHTSIRITNNVTSPFGISLEGRLCIDYSEKTIVDVDYYNKISSIKNDIYPVMRTSCCDEMLEQFSDDNYIVRLMSHNQINRLEFFFVDDGKLFNDKIDSMSLRVDGIDIETVNCSSNNRFIFDFGNKFLCYNDTVVGIVKTKEQLKPDEYVTFGKVYVKYMYYDSFPTKC